MIHKITWHDLEFERIPVEFYSTQGVPQTRLVRVGMPLIPPNVLNGVFYLYRSKADALNGVEPGGTGFIVRHDGTFTEEVPGHHFYGVTNWHVACQVDYDDNGHPVPPYSVIRLNTKAGDTDVMEFNIDDWHFLPDKYDVAVVPLMLDETLHDVSSISTRQFAEEPGAGGFDYHIGVGDDVFMIGLFIDHDGATTNVPSARFGNISMLPNPKATIEQPTNYQGESYVVDMHSRTGFSGSPVYVYRGSDLTEIWGSPFEALEVDNWATAFEYGGRRPRLRGRIRARRLFQLLGIHWAQFPEEFELRGIPKLKESRRRGLIVDGPHVVGMSGMTCVIPAWQILEVLNMPELKDLRHPGIVAAQKKNSLKPKPETTSHSTDNNPKHLEDFNRLVDVAARKRTRDDQS